MKISSNPRYLAVYSGVVTAVLLVVLLSAFAPNKKASFDELDVQRINLVEPDGTLRLVILDRARFPGYIVKRKERPHDRATAGMIFFNDEGTENGGLIFGGSKGADDRISSGSLTFDQYEQDQVIQLEQSERGDRRSAGLKINDQPEPPMDFDMLDRLNQLKGAAQDAEVKRLKKEGLIMRQRVFVGKQADHSAQIVLRDARSARRRHSGRARRRAGPEVSR